MENILIFGHSVVQGCWDSKGGWADRLKDHLVENALETQREEDVYYVFNVGVSSDTTKDLLERLEYEYRNRSEEKYEDLLMVQIGTNDVLEHDGEPRVELEDFEENFRKILQKAGNLADEVIIVGDFPVKTVENLPYSGNQSIDNEKLREYDEAKKNICSSRGIEFVDLYRLMRDEETSEYLEEGLHPNTEGHRRIFEAVKRRLESENILSS